MRYPSILTFLFVVCLSANYGFAQQVMTDSEGRQILLSPDGSWKYLNPDDVKTEPTTEAKPEPQADAKSEEDGAREMIEKTEAARTVATNLQRELEAYQQEIVSFTDYIKRLEDQNDPSLQETIAIKKRKLIDYETNEKALNARLAREQWYASNLEKLIFVPNKKRERLLPKIEEEYRSNSQELPSIVEQENTSSPTVSSALDDPQRTYKRYDYKNDVVLNPPKPNCVVIFDGTDDMIGRRRKDIAFRPLVTYTPIPLRGRTKTTHYISVDGSMTAAYGGIKVLNLEFKIASENARVEFGRLDKGSLLNFKLLDGTVVKMVNKTEDFGRFDRAQGVYVYRGQYQISAEAEKQLRDSELDKVRVVWSSGYEDYPIYEVDYFFNQFNCLDW